MSDPLVKKAPTLKPGEWWVQYIGPKRLHLRTPAMALNDAKPIELSRGETFILRETEALQLLASIQRPHPELIEYFHILEREPEFTESKGGAGYVRARTSQD